MTVVEIVGGLLVLAVLIALGFAVKIVREYQRVVLFRLGRSLGLRGPGLVFINPVTDRTMLVDLRERFLEIPAQTAITQDNASISIDFIIFYKVVDPAMSVLQVQNFAAAAQNVAATTLRSVVGDMVLDDVLSKREEMNASLRVRLDDVTERWGVKVTTVEVREVNPPVGVLDAMTRQMSAERTRRRLDHRGSGSEGGGHHARGGQQAGGDPCCRRGATVRHSPCGGTGRRTREDLGGRTGSGPEHHAAPVPRDIEERGDGSLDEDRRPDGTGRPNRRPAIPSPGRILERRGAIGECGTSR